MGCIKEISAIEADMVAWRQDIHAHPETAYEEFRTADKVADLLQSWNIVVDRGLAETGVVGTLVTGDGPSIGLRADLDALHVHEATGLDYQSVNAGKMHACGHDGHVAMLLGAARYLSETKRFKGTVRFIFQPAEENEGGGGRMVEEGLFERFPMDSIYGMHNWPGAEANTFGVRTGPVMASFDVFEAVVVGKGAHGAMPHLSIDPVSIGARIVCAWQSIVSRTVDPQDAAVVSVTQFHAGDTWNVIPERAMLRGTVRSFRPQVRDHLEQALHRMADGICSGAGASLEWCYDRRYPATVNHGPQTDIAAAAAARVVGAEKVVLDMPPSMGSEDFAFMLAERPGCYIRLGNGPGRDGCMLHNPGYDFNDDILVTGASYWATLVEMELPLS
ncbi:M20 aminoacylase family protein [Magnetospira sp. QH-2]|uniref:M20 aminoacylase family protein n=1 Tax=Magnetospira sp. (strain QH-2) TaxID=1288970 RepID=UPI0003E81AF4|nr:M20 aminoacylase family protein [Magnetospira sp. QH-2]CCQ73525.1 Hippurate hydrolase [Magnetospira sp. QH-2]